MRDSFDASSEASRKKLSELIKQNKITECDEFINSFMNLMILRASTGETIDYKKVLYGLFEPLQSLKKLVRSRDASWLFTLGHLIAVQGLAHFLHSEQLRRKSFEEMSEKVEQTRNFLNDMFKNEDWYVGTSIFGTPPNYYLLVFARDINDEIKRIVPDEINGFMVKLCSDSDFIDKQVSERESRAKKELIEELKKYYWFRGVESDGQDLVVLMSTTKAGALAFVPEAVKVDDTEFVVRYLVVGVDEITP